MSKRKPYVVPAVAGIDLDARPTSYWADHDPVSAVTQNIKGQRRREMARDFLEGDTPKAWGAIDESLLADTLDDAARVSLGQVHPSFMGGEYLPDYTSGEIEIARIVLASTTCDVYSIRAQWTAKRTRIRYRMLDEYGSTFELTPASSKRPLSLRELITLIDTAQSEEVDTMGLPFVKGHVAWQLDGGLSAEEAEGFVSVQSAVYAEVGAYYEGRVGGWVRARCADGDE